MDPKRINLVLTPEEETAIQTAIQDSRARGIILSRTAALRSYFWLGVHHFNQMAGNATKQKVAN